MRRALIPSSVFLKQARRLASRKPEAADDLEACLLLLEADAFDPRLRTHTLTGKLRLSWACSAGYDLRVVFQFVKQAGAEAILLQAVGTHDEVY